MMGWDGMFRIHLLSEEIDMIDIDIDVGGRY